MLNHPGGTDFTEDARQTSEDFLFSDYRRQLIGRLNAVEEGNDDRVVLNQRTNSSSDFRNLPGLNRHNHDIDSADFRRVTGREWITQMDVTDRAEHF